VELAPKNQPISPRQARPQSRLAVSRTNPPPLLNSSSIEFLRVFLRALRGFAVDSDENSKNSAIQIETHPNPPVRKKRTRRATTFHTKIKI